MASAAASFTGTLLIPIDAAAPDSATIAAAAAVLRAGGLVAFPTETVYGLGANALDREAVLRIFTAKQRPAHDPLIVHIAEAAELIALVRELPASASLLAEHFWPGPLTLVLPRTPLIPDEVTAGSDTVAVRAPAHPVARALLRAAALPIAAPSANRFGHTSPTTAAHVYDDLHGRIDLILDGGPTPIGVESTVIDLTGTVPIVLRPGGVPIEALREVLGRVDMQENARKEARVDAPHADLSQTPLHSPGLLDRHYAPRTPLLLFAGPRDRTLQAMIDAARDEMDVGRLPFILAYAEDAPLFAPLGCPVRVLGPEAEPSTVAQQLYAILRAADESGAHCLIARTGESFGMGAAVRDRMRRAAHTIVEVV